MPDLGQAGTAILIHTLALRSALARLMVGRTQLGGG